MLSFPNSPRSGQSYAAPNGQIYVFDGIKWLGTTVSGGGGGTTTITNNIENPFTFSVAADDSTQREVSSGEVIKFIGSGSITTASDAEGNITITGSGGGGGSTAWADITGKPTIPTLTSQLTNDSGFLTSVGTISYNDLSNKPNLAGTYQFSVAADDSTQRLVSTDEVIKFSGSTYITTASDTEGNITISWSGDQAVSTSSAVKFNTVRSNILAPLTVGATQYTITNIQRETPWTNPYITVSGSLAPGFTSGALLEISGVTTPSQANGSWYVQFRSSNSFRIYTNSGLTVAPDSTSWAAYTGSGIVKLPDTPTDLTITNNSFVWTFGIDGTLNLPETTSVGNAIVQSAYNVQINSNAQLWTFGTDGRTTLPGVGGYSYIDTDSQLQINANGSIWAFGTDGVLTLPNGSTIGDGESGTGVPITTTRGTILLGNQADCAGGESHFHIMKGGQQEIDLFLGDDNNYVKLPSTGGVEISSSEIGSQHYWTFGTDGSITFPDATVQTTAYTGTANIARNIESEGDVNVRVNLTDSTQNVWTFGEDGSFTVPNGISSFANFEVKINANDSTLQTFKFGEDGSITLPNNSQIRTGSTTYDAALAIWESARQQFELQATNLGITATGWPFIEWRVNGENATEYLAELTRAWQIQQQYPQVDPLVFVPPISASAYNQIRTAITTVRTAYGSVDSGVSISSGLGYSWNFNETGTLTLPGATTIIGGGANTFTLYTNSPTNTNGLEVSSNTETNLFNQSKVNIIANVNGVSNKVWKFDTDGSLTLPSEGKIINGSHQWTFGSTGLISLGATYGGIYANQTTGRISIGDSISSGGVGAAPSKVFYVGGNDWVARIAGYADSNAPVWTFGDDRSLNIPGSITSSGDIDIEINLTDSTMRRWTFGEDGDTVIPGDIKSDSGINIEINLADSTKRIWQFGEDGNLETPGDVTASGNITGNILKIEDGVHEKSQALSSATGVVTHDCSLGHVFYHTSPSANWTANFTNLNLASGYATTVSLIIVQGGTGYYPNAVQIAGSVQTILWQGNTTPTVSTNRTDVASFSIINNSGTYVVLGQITGF